MSIMMEELDKEFLNQLFFFTKPKCHS